MQSHPAPLRPRGRHGRGLRRRFKKHWDTDLAEEDGHGGDEALLLHTASEADPAFRPVGEAQFHRPGEGGRALIICRLQAGPYIYIYVYREKIVPVIITYILVLLGAARVALCM